MKVRFKATELEDSDVARISLVNRGAIRVPFRKMASEGSVGAEGGGAVSLFQQMFATRRKAETAEIAAFLVNPTVDLEKVKTALKAEGFSVDTVQDMKQGDVSVPMIVQVDGEILDSEGNLPASTVVMKYDDNLGVVVRNVSKEFVDFMTSPDFDENLAKQGFFPSIRSATDILQATIGTAVMKAESPSEASNSIQKAIAAYGEYVAKLTSALPKAAFKMDKSLDVAPIVEDGGKKDGETVAEATPVETPATDSGDADPKKDGEEGKPVEKTADPIAEITALLEKQAEATAAALTAGLAKVTEDIKILGARVEKAEQATTKVAQVTDKVAGTIFGSPPPADPPASVQKDENDEGGELLSFDTSNPAVRRKLKLDRTAGNR